MWIPCESRVKRQTVSDSLGRFLVILIAVCHCLTLSNLVESGGIEPPSASPLQAVLHAYSVHFKF